MDFVAGMPGAMTTGVNRDTTINGLPQSSLNVTMDGINIQDKGVKTERRIPGRHQADAGSDRRSDASSTTPGDASAVGGGSVQIMYRSRSG